MDLKGKRVFIVEDNLDNIWVMLCILKHSGADVQVDWWASGKSEQLVKVLPVDIIILDLMLSGGRTGFAVFDEIRSIPEACHIPIVAVSAMDASVALSKTREQGFAGFISKPVDIDLFPKQIASIINGNSVWYTGE
jgi:two-component system, cell cycle response regulator DivK